MPKQDNDLSVVLSGAGGFLGRHVLSAMLAEGMRVIAISSKRTSELESLCDVDFSASEIVVVDPADEDLLRQSLMGNDVFLNCAFPRNADGVHLASGLAFIEKLFMLAADCNVGSVINISSHSVYGSERSEPATEETPLSLESSYATAKYATELMLESTCRNTPHTNIRLASLIGPGFDQRVVNKMVKRALSEGTIEVADNGSRFDYLDVDDATRALMLLIQSDPSTWKSVYNVGPEQGYSLTEIAEAVYCSVWRESIHSCTIQEIDPIIKPFISIYSSEVFCSQFGWVPVYDLEAMINKIIQYELNMNIAATNKVDQ